ncbi:CCA tRNA nucleotidyltransferase [Candidatus Woesearchaeota archaeon]|nr:CCA tRNA nucleotidyltransferase [Candidatus Woesearchaeota archaeon]
MDILSHIKPTKEESLFLEKEAKLFLKELNHKLKKIRARAIIGGSFKKNTFLRGAKEIDIFVQFNYSIYKNQSQKLSSYLLKYLPKASVIHGSRDYFQVTRKDILFEVVPVLAIKNAKQAINVTDISPLHADYVSKHLTKKQADEVRLLKQFCRSNQIYGAESYIQGFSGYVLEILILNYKSFHATLKKASQWKDKTIIDTARAFKNTKELLSSLNAAKTHSPLILLDPVQPERNIAAALSKDKFEKFKKLARAYLKKPSQAFFKEKTFDPNSIKDGFLLKVIPKEGKIDVIGSKLMKAFAFLKESLAREGFSLKESSWHWKRECYFYFRPKERDLPKYEKHYGPFLDDIKNLEKFRRKWKKYKIQKERNRVFVNIPRKHQTFKECIVFLLKNSYLKTKVKTIKIVKDL